MPAAAVYVQVPIFERLARTHTHAQREREAATLGPAAPTAGAAAGGSGASIAGDESVDGGRVLTPAAQEAFLARQAAAERRKAEHVAAMRAATAPPLQPQLCAKSLEMVEAAQAAATPVPTSAAAVAGGASFLERVSHQLAKRENDAMRAKARLGRDPECTFAPAINPVSKQLPGRTAADLSRGDALKKETAMRLMRLRVEAHALEGVTFAPALNAKSKQATGRLRLLEEPDTYVERLAQEAAAAAERARAKAAEAEHAALSECTFTPAVHDAPEYVKRIARSMAIARAVRQGSEADAAPARPDWR